MALKPCIECGHMVSTRADRCPRCGREDPVPSRLTHAVVGFGCLPLIALGLLWLGFSLGGTTGAIFGGGLALFAVVSYFLMR